MRRSGSVLHRCGTTSRIVFLPTARNSPGFIAATSAWASLNSADSGGGGGGGAAARAGGGGAGGGSLTAAGAGAATGGGAAGSGARGAASTAAWPAPARCRRGLDLRLGRLRRGRGRCGLGFLRRRTRRGGLARRLRRGGRRRSGASAGAASRTGSTGTAGTASGFSPNIRRRRRSTLSFFSASASFSVMMAPGGQSRASERVTIWRTGSRQCTTGPSFAPAGGLRDDAARGGKRQSRGDQAGDRAGPDPMAAPPAGCTLLVAAGRPILVKSCRRVSWTCAGSARGRSTRLFMIAVESGKVKERKAAKILNFASFLKGLYETIHRH